MTWALPCAPFHRGSDLAFDPARLTTHLHVTPLLLELEAGPLPLDLALSGLSRQAELSAPAKLALAASAEARLLVEVPNGRDVADATCDAQTALAAAVRWLAGDDDVQAGGEAPAGIEDALGATGWEWEPLGAGRYRLTPPADIWPVRLLVTPHGGGVRLAPPPTAVRVSGPREAEAIRLFALEANARLRLVRFAVSVAPDGRVAVGRDVVLPTAATTGRWLIEAASALAVANAETAQALRALATPVVAEAYLEGRADRTG